MGRPKGTNTNAAERLLEGAGRGFRIGGYGGIGVDALAKEAGLTSGAFYAHFGSKADAFRLTLVDGLGFFRQGVQSFKDRHGADWVPAFIDFYFGERMDLGLSEACVLPTLTADAARADDRTREAYESALTALVDTVADGMTGPEPRDRAWRLLMVCAGGAGIARAVKDPVLRSELLTIAKRAALAV